MFKCFLASKHACDLVCTKTTLPPTTIPAKHPPGNEDGQLTSPLLPPPPNAKPGSGGAWGYAQA